MEMEKERETNRIIGKRVDAEVVHLCVELAFGVSCPVQLFEVVCGNSIVCGVHREAKADEEVRNEGGGFAEMGKRAESKETWAQAAVVLAETNPRQCSN
jgi:hypothetical protein